MNTAQLNKVPQSPPAPIAPIPKPVSAGHYSRTAVGTMEAAALCLAPEAFARAAAAAIHGILMLANEHLPLPQRLRLGREVAAESEGFLAVQSEADPAADLVPSTMDLHRAICNTLRRHDPEGAWIQTAPAIIIRQGADGTTHVARPNPRHTDELEEALPWRMDPKTGKTLPVPAHLS